WQADFNDCNSAEGADWWPGQRPNEVRRGQDLHANWTPDGWDLIDMVKNWSKLGFVVAKTVANKVELVEDERSPDLPSIPCHYPRRRPGGRGGGHHAGARRTFRRGHREVAIRAAAHWRDVAARCPAAARGAGGVGAFPCSRASAFAWRPVGLGRR